MHGAAYQFVQRAVFPREFKRVYDIGGRNVNGTVRDLFPTAQYTVVDIRPGANVDVVADAVEWSPAESADCVLCIEVLDHSERWRGLLEHIIGLLAPDGWLILTCATDPRPPHGVDGQAGGNEHYGNIDPADLLPIIDRHFGYWLMEVDRYPADLRVLAHDLKVAA